MNCILNICTLSFNSLTLVIEELFPFDCLNLDYFPVLNNNLVTIGWNS